VLVASFKVLPQHSQERIKKHHKTPQHRPVYGWNLNPGPSKYEPTALTARPQHLVWCHGMRRSSLFQKETFTCLCYFMKQYLAHKYIYISFYFKCKKNIIWLVKYTTKKNTCKKLYRPVAHPVTRTDGRIRKFNGPWTRSCFSSSIFQLPVLQNVFPPYLQVK
jgi:hypothetical protein